MSEIPIVKLKLFYSTETESKTLQSFLALRPAIRTVIRSHYDFGQGMSASNVSFNNQKT